MVGGRNSGLDPRCEAVFKNKPPCYSQHWSACEVFSLSAGAGETLSPEASGRRGLQERSRMCVTGSVQPQCRSARKFCRMVCSHPSAGGRWSSSRSSWGAPARRKRRVGKRRKTMRSCCQNCLCDREGSLTRVASGSHLGGWRRVARVAECGAAGQDQDLPKSRFARVENEPLQSARTASNDTGLCA